MTPVTAIKGLPVLPDRVVAGLDSSPPDSYSAAPAADHRTGRHATRGQLPIAIGYEETRQRSS